MTTATSPTATISPIATISPTAATISPIAAISPTAATSPTAVSLVYARCLCYAAATSPTSGASTTTSIKMVTITTTTAAFLRDSDSWTFLKSAAARFLVGCQAHVRSDLFWFVCSWSWRSRGRTSRSKSLRDEFVQSVDLSTTRSQFFRTFSDQFSSLRLIYSFKKIVLFS